MAWLVTKSRQEQASGATFTPSFTGLDIQTNDWIGICLTNDHPSGTTPAIAPPAGWTKVDTAFTVSGGVEHGWIYKIAASGAEAAPVITVNNDDTLAHIEIWRDVDTSTPIDCVATRADWNLASSATCNTASASAGSTVIYSVGADAAHRMRFKLSDAVCLDRAYTTAAAVAHLVGYRQLDGAATFSAVTAYGRDAAEGGTFCAFALRNKSGGAQSPDVRVTSQELKWYGAFGATHDGVTWLAPDQFAGTGVTIGGYAVSATTPTVLNTVPETTAANWGTSTSLATTDATANILIGGCHTITSANLTDCVASIEWRSNLASTSARSGAAGVLIGFSDGTNWSVFQIATQAYSWDSSDIHAALVACAAGKATAFATSGTLDWTAVTKVGYFWHKATANSGDALIIRNLTAISKVALTGGGASRAAKPTDISTALSAMGHIELAKLQSTKQVQVRHNTQIGDGTNATYYDHTAFSVEFPGRWSASTMDNWQMYFNALANALEIRVKAKASDTINTIAGVFATDTEQNFVMDSATSASATYSNNGLSLVNWLYTGDTEALVSGGTFSGCDEVAFKGADVTGVTITNTTSTDAACSWDANGGSMTSSTIDVTGTSAAYHIELGTSVTAITLTDVTFTGTPGTDKVHVLATTGTVTITISGTTSLVAGDVTSAGATVVIAAPQPTLSATVLASSRIVLYNNTTAAELDNTAPAGTSWSKVITSGASINDSLTLYAFKEGYEEFSTTFLYTGVNATLLVTQAVHTDIASLRTELGITDYTTITEFAPDTTGHVYIESNDVDGSSQKARAAIWYNGILTTEGGARYFRGGMTILSTAAFRINVSVVDMLFENLVSATPLRFTDIERRLYRSDGSSIIAPTSYSIHNDYSGVPDTVETGVSGLTGSESAQLMALPSAATIASTTVGTAVDGATTLAESLRLSNAVLGGKVSGAGTGTEVFRSPADDKDRVTATVDSSGNRTAITRDLT